MVESDIDALEEQPLRAVVACAARGAKRVFPLAARSIPDAHLHDAAIAAAESFGAGEPGDPARVADILRRIRQENPEREPVDGWPWREERARSAARFSGEAALYSFQAIVVFEQLERPGAAAAVKLASPLDSLRMAALEAAAEARAQALMAAGLTRNGRPAEAEDGFGYNDRELAISAFASDRRVFSRSVSVGVGGLEDAKWLGVVINPREDGPLGWLWPDGQAPAWYEERPFSELRVARPRLVPFEEFAVSLEWDHSTPNLVCWYLRDGVSEFERVVQTSRTRSSELHVPPPGFVVYAPGLNAEMAARFAAAGATVLQDRLIGGREPQDSTDLCHALAAQLRHNYEGWVEEPGGFRYAGARIGWRDEATLRLTDHSPPRTQSRPQALVNSANNNWNCLSRTVRSMPA